MQNNRVAKIALREVCGRRQLVYSLLLLALLEGWSRLLGWYDFAVKRDRHVVWDMAMTQKQNVQDLRTHEGGDQPTRPVAGERPVQRPAADQQLADTLMAGNVALKSNLFTIAKIAISLGLIAYVFSKVDLKRCGGQSGGGQPLVDPAGVRGFYLLAITINGMKW